MAKHVITYHCDECGTPVTRAERCPDHPSARLIRDAPHRDAPYTVAPYTDASASTPRIMITIKEVWINRAEGLIAECGKRSFPDLSSAERYLREAARTAPDTGGYDKCDFRITFSDGNTYEGRIDLKRDHTAGYSIAGHVIETLEFLTGARRPAHMTEERYRTFLAEPHIAVDRESMINFLANIRPALEGYTCKLCGQRIDDGKPCGCGARS